MWRIKGLADEPDTVRANTQQYRDSQDALGQFVADCCSITAGAELAAAELRQCYKIWCEQNGEYVVKSRRFLDYLREQHGIKTKKCSTIYYCGIELQAEEAARLRRLNKPWR